MKIQNLLFVTALLIGTLQANACVFYNNSMERVGWSNANGLILDNNSEAVGFVRGQVVYDSNVRRVGAVTGALVSSNYGPFGYIDGNVIATTTRGQLGFGSGGNCSTEVLGAAALLLF